MSVNNPPNVAIEKPVQKPKAKKTFTQIEEDKIIEYYSHNEHLWDPKHSNYKIGVKSLTIQTLVQELGNKFTASEIHHRFSGMRTTYRANANKVAASMTTGSDGSNVYVSTWAHYDSMKFLDATKPTRKSTTSFTIQTIDISESSTSDVLETSEMESEEFLVEEIECDENMQSKPTSSSSSKASTKHSKNKTTSSKGKQVTNDDIVEECLILRSVNKENDRPATVATDRCVSYGEFVTASLKDMTQWNQTLAMAEMTNVLIKYDRNNPN